MIGGQPLGVDKNYPGCTNKTPPKDDKIITIQHELYFSKSSTIWQNGGVAFIKSEKREESKTFGRMYLITPEQFVQVVRQENARVPDDGTIVIDIGKTIEDGQSMIDGGWYRRILYLGSESGYPIFTFTGGWDDEDIKLNAPREKYLKTIIKGLKETYGVSNDALLRYFSNVDGINGFFNENKLMNLIMDVNLSK